MQCNGLDSLGYNLSSRFNNSHGRPELSNRPPFFAAVREAIAEDIKQLANSLFPYYTNNLVQSFDSDPTPSFKTCLDSTLELYGANSRPWEALTTSDPMLLRWSCLRLAKSKSR